jgi:glycosyltransferase involved in cell wall biosynthesis
LYDLIANVIHTSLNARGGGERLAVATIEALSSTGIDVELGTYEKPDYELIRDAYGEGIESHVKKVRTLCMLSQLHDRMPVNNCDIVVNTHGDMLPFFRKGFTRKNAITYCHYPIAGYLMDCSDPDYGNLLQNLSLSGMTPGCRDRYFWMTRSRYKEMMVNSTVLTNSEFSRKAIFKTFGVDSTVLPPPVEVDTFRKILLSTEDREDVVLVISRFHPSKKIENAILLAKLLKQNQVGERMNIVGNISPGRAGYYNYLCQLIRRYNLEDFVKIEVNVKFGRLLSLMRRSKAYVHPLPGEPFGISTVEAMSAGIVPVVPDIGGHTEFVPAKYQFHTFGQGVQAVAAALRAPASERIKISHSIQKYSVASYIKKFQEIVAQVLDVSIKPVKPAPVISVSKRLQEYMAA